LELANRGIFGRLAFRVVVEGQSAIAHPQQHQARIQIALVRRIVIVITSLRAPKKV
jgi:uncharacterized NAD-dependent epimerase/dehydratase family protein